uniref:Polyadenylate-binding protein 1-like 2 n=1 Tax=Dermatophagoides pteronyssinus TaxID=6956 RepID=A0A6P6Y607_DERPT|nr:polyadenylate-binding protein 1-like 2 [Dermatophagoides pteronyssinus]
MVAAVGGQDSLTTISLYVGDLHPEVNETTLYDNFNTVGPVASIKVCRDMETRKSLGYAYVNYHTVQDAEKAMELLNFTEINGRPCRIMWSQRDPSLRRNNALNLVVRNLDPSVDSKALYDAFKRFGPIASCKVRRDAEGRSCGYGFVQFESLPVADEAMQRMNNTELNGKKISVVKFQRSSERQSGKQLYFTNVYTRDFFDSWTKDIFEKIFSRFGPVNSVYRAQDSKNRPYACVNFVQSEHAKAAISALHGAQFTEI